MFLILVSVPLAEWSEELDDQIKQEAGITPTAGVSESGVRRIQFDVSDLYVARAICERLKGLRHVKSMWREK